MHLSAGFVDLKDASQSMLDILRMRMLEDTEGLPPRWRFCESLTNSKNPQEGVAMATIPIDMVRGIHCVLLFSHFL